MNNYKHYAVKRKALGLFLLLLSVNLFALSDNADSLLIDVDWLKKHQHDKHLVLVDSRSREDYQRGHIAGAVNIPVAETFSPTIPTDRVADLKYIQQLFRSAGIHKGDTVVIYDDASYIDAGRVFWVFEVFGHKSVRLFNGGYAIWQAKNLPVELIATIKPYSDYIPEVEPQRLVTRLSMRLAIEDYDKVIIDARPAEDYHGQHSIAARSGHIPHAISIPWKDNFIKIDGINMLKSESDLRALYRRVGDKDVYTYCNKGKQSSLTYTLLRQLGKQVAHYDGSWFEWGNDLSLPIHSSALD